MVVDEESDAHLNRLITVFQSIPKDNLHSLIEEALHIVSATNGVQSAELDVPQCTIKFKFFYFNSNIDSLAKPADSVSIKSPDRLESNDQKRDQIQNTAQSNSDQGFCHLILIHQLVDSIAFGNSSIPDPQSSKVVYDWKDLVICECPDFKFPPPDSSFYKDMEVAVKQFLSDNCSEDELQDLKDSGLKDVIPGRLYDMFIDWFMNPEEEDEMEDPLTTISIPPSENTIDPITTFDFPLSEQYFEIDDVYTVHPAFIPIDPLLEPFADPPLLPITTNAQEAATPADTLKPLIDELFSGSECSFQGSHFEPFESHLASSDDESSSGSDIIPTSSTKKRKKSDAFSETSDYNNKIPVTPMPKTRRKKKQKHTTSVKSDRGFFNWKEAVRAHLPDYDIPNHKASKRLNDMNAAIDNFLIRECGHEYSGRESRIKLVPNHLEESFVAWFKAASEFSFQQDVPTPEVGIDYVAEQENGGASGYDSDEDDSRFWMDIIRERDPSFVFPSSYDLSLYPLMMKGIQQFLRKRCNTNELKILKRHLPRKFIPGTLVSLFVDWFFKAHQQGFRTDDDQVATKNLGTEPMYWKDLITTHFPDFVFPALMESATFYNPTMYENMVYSVNRFVATECPDAGDGATMNIPKENQSQFIEWFREMAKKGFKQDYTDYETDSEYDDITRAMACKTLPVPQSELPTLAIPSQGLKGVPQKAYPCVPSSSTTPLPKKAIQAHASTSKRKAESNLGDGDWQQVVQFYYPEWMKDLSKNHFNYKARILKDLPNFFGQYLTEEEMQNSLKSRSSSKLIPARLHEKFIEWFKQRDRVSFKSDEPQSIAAEPWIDVVRQKFPAFQGDIMRFATNITRFLNEECEQEESVQMQSFDIPRIPSRLIDKFLDWFTGIQDTGLDTTPQLCGHTSEDETG